MPDTPTFSIVVPCYNYGRYLEETLESIRIQNRPDIQVILVDDASTDNTPEIAERNLHWIHYVRNESNLGAGGAWSVGLKLATGRYVMKLDADDRLLPGFCDAMQTAFELDPAIGAVICSVLLNREAKGTRKPQYVNDRDCVLDADTFRLRLLQSFFFRMPGCMLRRTTLAGHGLPDETLYQIHDWEFFLRVTNGWKAALVHQPFAEYRIHVSSITATAQKDNRLKRDIQRWLSIATTPGEHFIEPAQLKILRGGMADLLLIGFGSKWQLESYTNYCLKYAQALKLAWSAGFSHLLRIHGVLFAKIVRHITLTAEK